MAPLHLTARDRASLAQTARHSADAREARRALALLDLDAGEPAARVAGRYRVSRSTMYEWAARCADRARPRPARLRDARRSGRPPERRDAVAGALAEVLPTDPRGHGYRHPAWTTPLLLAHLRRRGVEASEATVRRALHRLGDRWKPPRFVRSRRRPHWRQAKGGSGGV
jgi:transposase